MTSVAAGSVIVQMPPLNQILQTGSGLTNCQNVVGTLTLTSTALTCLPVTTTLTYRVDPPSITSASPTNLNQDGSPFPAIGAPATITVLGTNFVDPVTVEITKGGAGVATVNNAVVSNSGTLTFPAPALADSLMNRQNCHSGGAVIGSKMVPTSFGIRIRSQRTGCSAELPAILVYNPINGACTAGLAITTASLPLRDGVPGVQRDRHRGRRGPAVLLQPERAAGGLLAEYLDRPDHLDRTSPVDGPGGRPGDRERDDHGDRQRRRRP